MNEQQAKHEEARKQVWSSAWSATANANDCKNKEVATSWADHALAEFDKRFPRPY